MKPNLVHYLTRKQMDNILKCWGVSEKLPGKNRALLVAFASPQNPQLARITLDKHKATYGEALFRLEFPS